MAESVFRMYNRVGSETTETESWFMGGFDPTCLTDLDHQLANAWRKAAVELGISVIAPFELLVGPSIFRYGALIVGFCTTKGILLRSMSDEFHPDQCGAICTVASETGYSAANLSPMLCQFDRDNFIEFLNIFPWCGPQAERPLWHTGPVDFDQPMLSADCDQ